MKYLITLMFAALFVSCSDNNRGIEFENTIINFGQAKVDDDILATFVFKNDSDDSVIIYDATYDCNCISFRGKEFPYKVSPHTTDSLTVKIDGTVEEPGFKSKNIAVRTDREPKIHMLKIEGNIL